MKTSGCLWRGKPVESLSRPELIAAVLQMGMALKRLREERLGSRKEKSK